MKRVDEICAEALVAFGPEAQVDMCIEECAELIVALQHWKRGRPSDVVTEIADVQIMCEQMQELFGDGAVNTERHRKWQRLIERIEDSKK